MAHGRKSNKKKRKREYKRSEFPSDNPKAVICYCPKVCPDVMRVKLRYTETQLLTGGGLSSVNSFVYRGNSLFDPNLSGGGGQPMGRDEWANFYKRYRVLACKVTTRFAPDVAGTVMSGGIVALTSSAQLSSGEQYQEQTYSKFKPCGNTGATGQTTISMYCTTAQVRGTNYISPRVNGDLSSLMTTNPVEQWYYHIVAKADDTATTWTMAIVTELEYYVELYDRETLQRS